MITLVHIPTGLATPEIEIMLSRAQAGIDKGEDVIVVGCPGTKSYACSFNIYGLAPICYVCKQQRSRGVEKLRGRFTYLESPTIHPDQDTAPLLNAEIKDRWAIKSRTYRSVDVGQAAYSSYVGLARDLDLEGALAWLSLKKLIDTARLLSEYWFDLLKEKKVNRVILYNGRQNQNRPLLRVSRLLGIEVEIMEHSGLHASCVYTFKNCLPQDLGNLASLMDRCWEEFVGDREEIARQYFEYKRQGGAINDRSYVLGQVPGLLPEGWDQSKRNVVIFNSSEDEFAAVGGEFDETVYQSQTDAIARVCDALRNEPAIRICLRIHPNLDGVQWSFSVKLLELGKLYPNVVVVPPESPISTYALLEACDVAVSFGSTIGIEAAYWGKPSILAGRCAYERTGSVYVPSSHDELIVLLKDSSLRGLPSLGAKKAALFWSRGGSAIDHFGGTRARGFTFRGQHIGKRAIDKALYLLFKAIERWLLGKFINCYIGMMRIAFRRRFGLLC